MLKACVNAGLVKFWPKVTLDFVPTCFSTQHYGGENSASQIPNLSFFIEKRGLAKMTGYATRTGENVSLWRTVDDKLWFPSDNNHMIFNVF